VTSLLSDMQTVPLSAIKPHPENPRRGNVAAIAASLDLNKQYRPLVVQRSTGFILAGNHTWRGAESLGWPTVEVVYVDVSDDRARRIMAADNRTADLGTYDDEALVLLLQSLEGDLAGTGYDGEALAELVAGLNSAARQGDPDAAPALADGPSRTRQGQVWELGPHLLAVGDCRRPELLDEMLQGRPVDLLLTDPPYGVSYVGAGGKRIANDDLRDDALERLLRDAFRAAHGRLVPGAGFYIFGPSHEQQLMFRQALRGAGMQVRQELVWVKNGIVLGRSDYQPQHESILAGTSVALDGPVDPGPDDPDAVPDDTNFHDVLFYGWRAGAAHLWRGGRATSSVLEWPKPVSSAEHPTMKPVGMLEYMVRNSSRADALVLDPFAGSGSTLIACHGTGRRCAAVELDVRYADVILRRYEEHAGVGAVLRTEGLYSPDADSDLS
jgi:DNA modification methylase